MVAPAGVLLMVAVLYFSAIMLDADALWMTGRGIYRTRTARATRWKVTMWNGFTIDDQPTSSMATAQQLHTDALRAPSADHIKTWNGARLMLLPRYCFCVSVGPMHLAPWSGTSVRAMSIVESQMQGTRFNPNIPAMLVDWPGCYLLHTFWTKEKGSALMSSITGTQKIWTTNKSVCEDQNNFIHKCRLPISLITILLMGKVPAFGVIYRSTYGLFIIATAKLPDQQKVMKAHGSGGFWCRVRIFAAGVYSVFLLNQRWSKQWQNELVTLFREDASPFRQ